MGLADDIKKLSEDIIASYDLRVKGIRELTKDTHNTLKGFQDEHKKMATDLRNNLEKGEADRLKDFKSMMGDAKKFVGDVKKFVSDMVEETGSLMNQIRAEQKNRNKAVSDLLEKFAKDHEVMTKSLISEIKARQDERNKEVLNLLQEFKTEREGMAANWQALTATMVKKRGIKPIVEAEVKVRPVKEAVEEEEEEEVPPEMGMEERVLEFIERHPEGVKVGDMEEPLGVSRLRLGKVAKRLLEKGKVRKEGNIYFPL
jgi:hypothetical protein